MASLTGEPRQSIELTRRGGGVWAGRLPADGAIRYWVEAQDAGGTRAVSPPDAPHAAYSAQCSTHRSTA
jgi:hypothetical protein